MPHIYCFRWLAANPFPVILPWLSQGDTNKNHTLSPLFERTANNQFPSDQLQSIDEVTPTTHSHFLCHLFILFWAARACPATHSPIEIYEWRATWKSIWFATWAKARRKFFFILWPCCAHPLTQTQATTTRLQPSFTIWTATCQTTSNRICSPKFNPA